VKLHFGKTVLSETVEQSVRKRKRLPYKNAPYARQRGTDALSVNPAPLGRAARFAYDPKIGRMAALRMG
jgi:hypothetical protein